ncbi:MAG: NAD(P)/FAD-dependent oxidoreductase [Clostridia bacterium]|nr:NAD(P)/FAD-dependent oxidoreductase [Clostridia bacterium]
MKRFDVIIIGGCASGLVAAINAHRLYPEMSIAVVEKLPRTGKKILATGNGRCNLTNINTRCGCYTNGGFAKTALEKYSVEKSLEFFSSLGLKTYTDSEGRVYPTSNTAASVVDALRFNLDGIEVITGEAVTDVKKQDGGFVLNNEYRCNYLITATGGKASPSQGSDGSGYALAKALGHTVTNLYPALVPLTADPAVTKPLKGVRIHNAVITLEKNGKSICPARGEILFTDSGISGIAAMELAASLERIKEKGADIFAVIDLAPDMSREEIIEYLTVLRKENRRDFDSLLTGIIPKAAGIAVLKKSGVKSTISGFSENEIKIISEHIKQFRIKVTGTKGFDCAQVTSGGVRTDEINNETMESLICENLFFAGEIIDVDGICCGGFNLQWAWSSGLTAGELGGKAQC